MNAPVPVEAARAPTIYSALLPTQREALEKLLRFSDAASIVLLQGECGTGKSMILRAFQEARGGTPIGYDAIIDRARRNAELTGDSITGLIDEALAESDIVIVDHVVSLYMSNARGNDAAFQLARQMSLAFDHGRKFVAAGGAYVAGLSSHSPNRSWIVKIGHFTLEDYRVFFRNSLGESGLAALDMGSIYRHAPALNGYELKRLCEMLMSQSSVTTETALAVLDRHILRSNTKVERVEPLRFDELPGSEHIADKLETHVMLPLQNSQLSERLDLKPKRGVLLYGPPGTGKTSIGRALAHRMKGKFFLIDGNIGTEPPAQFFRRVKEIVQQAKENAPCVLFVDDADVLFGIVHISGFARYLLTLLDGMESESVGKVCLMMTAMDVTKVPSAILRSGRVELWLETRPPDAATRAAILERWLGTSLPDGETVDFAEIAEQAEGFTPADLRRVIADAHAYFAADVVAGHAHRSTESYLMHSVRELTATRARMADNLRDESLRVGKNAVRGKYGSGIGGLVEAGTGCAVKGW